VVAQVHGGAVVAADAIGRPRSRVWRTLRRDPAFWFGAVIVALGVGAALFAPLIAPHDPNQAFRADGLTPGGDPVGPSAKYPLGTDRLGRDELSRLIYGARTSLIIGLGANVIATLIGVSVGSIAAFAGRPSLRVGRGRRSVEVGVPVESLLMRTTDVFLSLPALLIAIAVVAVVGPSIQVVIGVVALLLWTAIARVVYGRVLVVGRSDFISAGMAAGIARRRLLLRHVMPHVMPIIVVYTTLGIATTILFEATLSYLGVGVPPPTASWGSMFADHVGFYRTDPLVVILPGLAIVFTILAFNLLGDALQDALDPRSWR